MASLKTPEGLHEAIAAKQMPLASQGFIMELVALCVMPAMLIYSIIHICYSHQAGSLATSLFLAGMALCFIVGLVRFGSIRALTPFCHAMSVAHKTRVLENLFNEKKKISGYIVTTGRADAITRSFFSDLHIIILYDDNGFYFNAAYGRSITSWELDNYRKRIINGIIGRIKELSGSSSESERASAG